MNTKVEKCTCVLADGRGRYCAVGAILHELYNWNPEYKTEGTPLSLTNPEVNRMFNESILKEIPESYINIIMSMNDGTMLSFSDIGKKVKLRVEQEGC